VQNTFKSVSWIGRRGFMISQECHGRHICHLPPLSWCMVWLHAVACLQLCISQATAGPHNTMWTLWLVTQLCWAP